jgi:hypothetical protein
MASLGKTTYDVCFRTQFSQFSKKEVGIDQVACYNIVAIRIDIFLFLVSIISNLVFPSYHIPPPI